MQESLEIYKSVLEQEALALIKAKDRLSLEMAKSWQDLVGHLIENQSQLIFSGVGKSGIIAQKMASTFCSLGQSSFFLHPVEALHGDLGKVREQDVLVVISKSGNTEELLKLIPYAKIPKTRRVGILGTLPSPLAQQCQIIFDATVESEACINDLAPTTSSTLALAIGDAMAVIYEHFSGLSKELFALNHPAGRLGRSLTLKVKDVMITAEQCAVVDISSSFKDALLAMTAHPVGLCAVVNNLAERMLRGILVEGDIRRLLLEDDHLLNSQVDKVMNHKPICILENSMAMEAFKIMEGGKKIRTHIPVINEKGQFAGIVRHHELFKEL